MDIRMRHNQRRSGFTLIEASLTTIIIGVGVVAMMQLLTAGTLNNIQAFETTTGVNVAKAVREIAVQDSLTQVLAMNGKSYQPPIDSRSQPITDLATWKQSIAVQPVVRDNLTTNIVDPNPTAVRVTVTVSHNGNQVCQMNWYTFAPTP
jgi:type II secretory pathway pseudopilin PulG